MGIARRGKGLLLGPVAPGNRRALRHGARDRVLHRVRRDEQRRRHGQGPRQAAKARARDIVTGMKKQWASLKPGPANFSALSPVGFLPRAAEIYPDRVAVVHGSSRFTYEEFFERAKRLASALAKRGVRRGDVV